MAEEAAAFRSLTLLVAVLEEASAVLVDLAPAGTHGALVERIDALRNLIVTELRAGRFSA